MITLRVANQRHHDRRRKRDVFCTFYPGNDAETLADGFEALEFLDEDRLPPGARIPRLRDRDAEIVTYVHEGALTHEDSMGGSGVVQTGEFQRRATGCGISHRERNASRTNSAHVFQIWLRPSEVGFNPGQEQKRFSAAERRGGLCIVASPDARRGSLRVHQDALLYSAMLDRGQHVVHELSEGRRAWLHLVQGEVTLGDLVLRTGDGAGVTAERAVSLTAQEDAEILLVDLGRTAPRSRENGRAP